MNATVTNFTFKQVRELETYYSKDRAGTIQIRRLSVTDTGILIVEYGEYRYLLRPGKPPQSLIILKTNEITR